MIRDHHVDFAICSAKGLDANMGITESNEKDAEMKKAIFNAATTKVLAMDNTKFDNISFIKVCDIKDVDIIVTDRSPGAAWEKRFTDNHVDLVIYGDNHENLGN